MFGLIRKQKIKNDLCVMLYNMAITQEPLKKKCDDKRITEWTYYKKYNTLMGRLYMLEEIIKSL